MLSSVHTFAEWREAARPLLARRIRADEVAWSDLDAAPVDDAAATAATFRLPRAVMQLLERVSMYRDAGRWELMYRLAWRLLVENPRLLEDAADRDVARVTLMDRAIRRDCHKMHAFVRFREISEPPRESVYFSWFEPAHLILRSTAQFFVKRFSNMQWIIATPDGAAQWDRSTLRFVDKPELSRPDSDGHEDLWRLYYKSICNVARINPAAMRREMPQRYWRDLPEAEEIGVLIRDGMSNFAGRHRESNEAAHPMTKAVKRAISNLPVPGEGLQECRRCELWKGATQAVRGEGRNDSKIMLVGEQPGDEEDLRGHPFVGPAGKVLDAALIAAGLERGALFITNAVKHFKWEPRGKRRLHKKPEVREIEACNTWLVREIADVEPRVIVALGASALRALVGTSLSVEASRGKTLESASGTRVLATYHPSAILRSEGERSDELRAMLVEDLGRAKDIAGGFTVGAARQKLNV